MDCKPDLARSELIEKYLNQQLAPAQQDDFEVHLLECGRCQRSVELLQLVREDLVQRAHEIRDYSGAREFRLRWQWAALACAVLVAGGLGVVQWIRLHPKQAATTVAPPTQPAQSPSSQDSTLAWDGRSTSQQPESAAKANGKALGGGPVHSEAVTSGTASEGPKPEVTEAPAVSARSEVAAAADGGPAASSPDFAPGVQSPQTATGKNDATAVELFNLGIVKPPPFTFAGFAAGAKPPPTAGIRPNALKPSAKGPLPQGERVVFRSAMVAYIEGRYDDAASLLENALNTEPDAADVNFYFGVCKLLQGRPGDSLAPLKKALGQNNLPITQSAHFYLGKAYLQTGNLAEAETQFQAAAEMAGPIKAEADSALARLRAVLAARQKP